MEPNESLLSNTLPVEEFLVEDTNDEAEADYVSALVGEGKKFRDYNALAKGKLFSDQHIARLQEELRQEREAKQQNRTVEEILNALEKKTAAPKEHDNVFEQREVADKERTKEVSIDEITAQVQAQIEAKTVKQKESANLDAVKRALAAEYGNAYPTVISKVLEDKGIDLSTLDTLAKKSPKAALDLLGVKQTSNNSTNLSPNPRISSGGFNNKTGQKDMAYFEKIRKTDPKLYETSKFQMDMLNELSKQYK